METIEPDINVIFDRKNVFLLLVLFFLCWRPGFLGSESLTLTTYYPAPYGGYVSILTTGQTLLARDGGNVGINTAIPTQKLHVANGSISIETGDLIISGNGISSGRIIGLCTWRTMGPGLSSCGPGENLVNTNFTTMATEWACIGAMGAGMCIAGNKQVGLSGTMLCCRIQ